MTRNLNLHPVPRPVGKRYTERGRTIFGTVGLVVLGIAAGEALYDGNSVALALVGGFLLVAAILDRIADK